MKKIFSVLSITLFLIVCYTSNLEAVFFDFAQTAGSLDVVPESQNNPETYNLPTFVLNADGMITVSPREWLTQYFTNLLSEYNTPQKAYELAIEIQGEEIFYEGVHLPQHRTVQEILKQRNATSEEVAYIQARALDIAGYEVRIVSVPINTSRGMQKVSFVAYKDRINGFWNLIIVPGNIEYRNFDRFGFGRSILEQGIPEDGIIHIEADTLEELISVIDSKKDNEFDYAEVNSGDPILESTEQGVIINQPEELYPLMSEIIEDIPSYKIRNIEQMYSQFKYILMSQGNHLDNFPETEELIERLYGDIFYYHSVISLLSYWLNNIQLLPLDHLENIGTIHFNGNDDLDDFLEYHMGNTHPFPENLIFGMDINTSFGAFIHEVEHIVGFHTLGNPYLDIVGIERNSQFQIDLEFIEEFYPTVWYDNIRFILFGGETARHETFATMADKYITSPRDLRSWIIDRLKEDSTLAALNYLFLKENVFHNLEYGDTSQLRFWKGWDETLEKEVIYYTSLTQSGFVPI